MKITKEHFEEWHAHPVTEEVFKALEVFAEDAKQAWVAQSWEGNNPDPLQLRDLKARATVATDLRHWTFEEMERLLDDEQDRN